MTSWDRIRNEDRRDMELTVRRNDEDHRRFMDAVREDVQRAGVTEEHAGKGGRSFAVAKKEEREAKLQAKSRYDDLVNKPLLYATRSS